jgi:ADP-ribose pyrophosphatase YjhB (NUDIX family)
MSRIDWIRRLQTISQAGLTYSRDPYDRERFEQLQALAAEMAVDDPADAPRALEVLRLEQGYATPKVDVRAVVARSGKLLLMREAQDGRWSLPGGWADLGEPPSQVAEREVLEETGYVVRAVKLLAVWDNTKHQHPASVWHTYKLFLRCELEGGAPHYGHETLDSGFFGADELPPLSLPRVTASQLERLFAHLEHPDYPSDFD